MQNQIRIVSTKKLSEQQKQQLLNVNFWVFDEDYINIVNKCFEIQNINDYLIFTSKNAVESILGNNKIAEIKTKKCFCVGGKTKVLLEQNNFEVIEYSGYAAELASIIFNRYSTNSFTFFCGTIRRDVLPDALRLAEIRLDEVEVYETNLIAHKNYFEPHGILFFSPSAIESYQEENKIEDEVCFCIGNTTAEALKYITPNIVIANQPNIESTIMKCIDYYKN